MTTSKANIERKHITKEDFYLIEPGDGISIRQDLEYKRYDGNSFVNGMETTEILKVCSNPERAGISVVEISYRYTYDMISTVWRDGKIIMSYEQSPSIESLKKVTHEMFIEHLKEKGITPTARDIELSRDYISDEDYSNIEEGDEIILKGNLVCGRYYGRYTFQQKMGQFKRETGEFIKLIVQYKSELKDYVTTGQTEGKYSQQMIARVIKKPKSVTENEISF